MLAGASADERVSASTFIMGQRDPGDAGMPVRVEQQKNEAVESAAALAAQRLGRERGDDVARFLRQFYGHVPPDDILARPAEDLYGAALSLWRFAETRMPGQAKVRAI